MKRVLITRLSLSIVRETVTQSCHESGMNFKDKFLQAVNSEIEVAKRKKLRYVAFHYDLSFESRKQVSYRSDAAAAELTAKMWFIVKSFRTQDCIPSHYTVIDLRME